MHGRFGNGDALNQAVATFIRGDGNWDVWATVTFAHEVTKYPTAERRFKEFCKDLAKQTGVHVKAGWVWGKQRSGRFHFHAVLRATGPGADFKLTCSDVRSVRAPGRIFPAPYEKGLSLASGAEGYMVRKHEGWDFGMFCPRKRMCRRKGRGCVLEKGTNLSPASPRTTGAHDLHT